MNRAFGLALRTYHTLDTTHTPFVNLNRQMGDEIYDSLAKTDLVISCIALTKVFIEHSNPTTNA
jgi:hypothetical protein